MSEELIWTSQPAFYVENGKKETLKSLSALLKWADKFQRENLAEIKKILAAYPEKVRTPQ